jgi:flavin-dependent dehydrogenase
MDDAVDVLVVGGGPAGSSVANIVAQGNNHVLVLEKDVFPRYHIGESLIPFTYNSLERLGVIPELRNSSFTKKYSVQFAQEDGTLHKPFYFSDRYDINTVAQTWQVDRSKFDKMLLDKAVERGAKVIHNARVDELIYSDKRVVGVKYTDLINNTTKEVFAKWVVDASGRKALAAKKNSWMERDPLLRNKMAIWSYFKGCKRADGIDGGATIVAFIKNKGWFWYIPLENDITSVGVVAESSYLMRDGIRGIGNVFSREVQNNKWLSRQLKDVERTSEFASTTDYSLHSKCSTAPGVVLVGDALAFLDPVFSSGVLLALKSGVMVGDVLNKALSDPTTEDSCFDSYHDCMQLSIENMRKLIHAFYNINLSFKDIIQQHPWAVDQITDCLSGDLERDYAELWNLLK